MMLSLRALTFAMSTVTSPVPMPYSAPRRARCAACALATSVLVGMQPEFTQVPPTSLRSITATVCPAAVSRPASGGPAWPAPMMIASNRLCLAAAIQMTDDERDDRESAARRDGVLDRARPGRSLPPLAAATSRVRASAPPRVPSTAPINAAPTAPTTKPCGSRTRCRCTAPANAPVISRATNCGGYLATRRLRQLVGDEFARPRIVSTVTVIGMRHPLRPGAVEVDPAEHRTPGHHRRCGHRAQTGDHTDQQGEQQNQEHDVMRTSGPVEMTSGR